MKIVLIHNHYDEKHLKEVTAEMKNLGAPTIRAYGLGFDGLYQAIEGCHRLRACEQSGVTPNVEIIPDYTKICDISDIDLDDFDENSEVSEIGDWENYYIEIDEHEDRILSLDEK